MSYNDKKITAKYALTALLAVIFTWILHEFAHWLSSEALGYDTIMCLNSTSLKNGNYGSQNHSSIVSIAGPIITIFQGLIAFLILQKHWNKYVYLFLFVPFYMRFMAGMMNFIKLNDEARVSSDLGLGSITLPLVVIGILFYLVYRASQRQKLKRKFLLISFLLVMLFSSILILSDQFFYLRLI